MGREIKFRCWDKVTNKMIAEGFHIIGEVTMFGCIDVYANQNPMPKEGYESALEYDLARYDQFELMQWTGLPDKTGKDIYEGDYIEWFEPYRTTQTHTGDNIPLGSYTEPMEPGIMKKEGIVRFIDGMFQVDQEDSEFYPLAYAIRKWDLEEVSEAIVIRKMIFDDPEEGDLQYLINEVAKVGSREELLELFNGVTVIGNCFEHPQLLEP